MDGPTDWTRFYPSTAADSTVVSTGPAPAQPAHNSIEGRVGKSARKRTRASRRAPTTLLNTDPTNFRAMVQQFTGAPAGPYSGPPGPVINFGYGDRLQQQQTQVLSPFGQRYDGEVILPGGNASENFAQSGVNNSTNGGSYFSEGMNMMGGNNRTGGYLF